MTTDARSPILCYTRGLADILRSVAAGHIVDRQRLYPRHSARRCPDSGRNKKSYNFEVPSAGLFAIKLAFISIVPGLITWVLAGYNGLSWTLVIVVVGVYHFMTQQTVLGRHIYAVGGNPEAAELSGISVKRITFIGGVSAAGGVGKVTGSLLGALVYMSLMNGMNLMNTDISLQYVIRGGVLTLACSRWRAHGGRHIRCGYKEEKGLIPGL